MFHLYMLINQSAFTEHVKYAQACPQGIWHLVEESALKQQHILNN